MKERFDSSLSATTGAWTTRLATATGALAAVALSPAVGKAAVISVTGAPVSLSSTAGLGTTAYWDVDGDGSSDFRLFNGQTYYGSQALFFGSDGSNGRGLVGPTSYGYVGDNVIALNTSFNVGPTLAAGNGWGIGSYSFRNMMDISGDIGYDWSYGFGQGDNFFGFRFDKAGSLYYGVGVVNFDSPNQLVTISSWSYNNVADQPVHVGSSVEVPGPIGLAGLAAGAAWTRKLRKRVKAAA
jgi:hypothetical protein